MALDEVPSPPPARAEDAPAFDAVPSAVPADEDAGLRSEGVHTSRVGRRLNNLHRETALINNRTLSPISPLRRALAITAAVFPGVIVRGTGSYLVREKPTARRLLYTGAIGVGGMIVGGLAVGGTGGNEWFVWPGVPLLVAGTGLFATSWLSDLWVAAGGRRTLPEARSPVPWAVEAGGVYLRDPAHPRMLATAGARVTFERVEVAGQGWFHADALEGRVDARVRLLGAAHTGDVIEDGSRVTVRAGVRGRDDDDDDLRSWTGEVELIGRLDMRRLGRALTGSFIELSTGLGLEHVRYPRGATENSSLLLGRFVWGAYLGRRGEATVFYDHRRDHLAGGIAAARAAGFIGSFGANVDVRIAGPWAIRAEHEFGTAWVSTLALRYQGGAR